MPTPPPWMEWDQAKAAWNHKVHGVSFTEAARFEFETALEVEVQEHGEEQRTVALGRIGRALHALVYTIRHGKIRVISLRRAEAHERRAYREKRGY